MFTNGHINSRLTRYITTKYQRTTDQFSNICHLTDDIFNEIFISKTLSAFIHGCISADTHFREYFAATVRSRMCKRNKFITNGLITKRYCHLQATQIVIICIAWFFFLDIQHMQIEIRHVSKQRLFIRNLLFIRHFTFFGDHDVALLKICTVK